MGAGCRIHTITADSGFLDIVEAGDKILADKGFPGIRTVLGERNAMPPPCFELQFPRSITLRNGRSGHAADSWARRPLSRISWRAVAV